MLNKKTKLKGDARTDKQILEEVLLCYLLCLALDNVGKDEDNKYEVPKTWVNLLNQDSFIPLQDLNRLRAKEIAKRIEREVSTCFTNMKRVTTYREVVLMLALTIVHFVKIGKIQEASRQFCLISALIVDEQNTQNDWADMNLCINSSNDFIKHLNFMGFYN